MSPKTKLMRPVLVALVVSVAQAHVTVQPRETTAGATQKYTMRVPNEKSIPNVRLEAEFPSNVEITAIDEKAGWNIEVKKDASGKITGAVWSGGKLAPRDIVEFGFSARNPKEETKLVWKIVQIYEDGSHSDWTPATQVKP